MGCPQRLLESPIDGRGAERFASAGMSEDEIFTIPVLRPAKMAVKSGRDLWRHWH